MLQIACIWMDLLNIETLADTLSWAGLISNKINGSSPASHCGGLGSNPGLVMWDFVMD
jgi:hypothetical protein